MLIFRSKSRMWCSSLKCRILIITELRVSRLKQEDEAWTEVGHSYNSFRSNVLAELDERRKEFPSAKAKGKQRSIEEDILLWDISEQDLPEHFRGGDGLELAKSLVKAKKEQESPLAQRIADLEYTVSTFQRTERVWIY